MESRGVFVGGVDVALHAFDKLKGFICGLDMRRLVELCGVLGKFAAFWASLPRLAGLCGVPESYAAIRRILGGFLGIAGSFCWSSCCRAECF
ncbi:hypothetical protein [Sporosarcina sp. ITBMC105]